MKQNLPDITMTPIGIIHTPFKSAKNVPIQSSSEQAQVGTIEIFEKYTPGLKDIEGFSHLILLYYFHLVKATKLQVIPYLDNKEHGIYATRAPIRPNHIGLSHVELIERKNNILKIKGLDMVDQTPLLDIKPHVPHFDHVSGREQITIGWLSDKVQDHHVTTDDGRFIY